MNTNRDLRQSRMMVLISATVPGARCLRHTWKRIVSSPGRALTCKRAARRRPAALGSSSSSQRLALLLDLRKLAHFVGRHAELDVLAGAGELALGDGDQLAADAEEATGLE